MLSRVPTRYQVPKFQEFQVPECIPEFRVGIKFQSSTSSGVPG